MMQLIVRKEEFKQDAAWSDNKTIVNPDVGQLIEGLLVTRLIRRTDQRGTLIELLTQRDRNGRMIGWHTRTVISGWFSMIFAKTVRPMEC